MKQLLSLFLFLLPCLAWAQYPSNGNQKITLGEQTTADGLIYRGLAADTTRKPSIDTMAYMVLDTTTNIMWHYKKATSNAWLRVGGSITSGLTGVLPLANGGTGASVRTFVDTINTQTVNGAKTFTSALTATRFNPTANTATGTGMFAPTSTSLSFSTNSAQQMTILNNGNVGIGIASPNYKLSVQGDIGIESAEEYIYFNSLYVVGNNARSKIRGVGAGGGSGYGGDFRVSTRAPNNAWNEDALTVDASGSLGIGTITPTEKLHVVGNGRFTAVGAGAYSNDLNITSTGVLTTASSSDETFKYNINPITYGLSTILQLKPVSFQWKKGDEHDLGFIAQDAVNIIPEAVDTFWDSSLLFRSNTIIPILTKAIQEQQALIKALEQRIINLENK
jgi:hypothetical protein